MDHLQPMEENADHRRESKIETLSWWRVKVFGNETKTNNVAYGPIYIPWYSFVEGALKDGKFD